MPRFKRGDRIRILANGGPLFEGLSADVVEVKPHTRDSLLDSYLVIFPSGEKRLFLDAQLETTHEPDGSQSANR